ncbi:hypothetical protein FHG87_005199, partial [Trinorchestia longiramus]
FSEHRFVPRETGALQALFEMESRLAGVFDNFSALQHPLIQGEEGVSLLCQWEELKTRVQECRDGILQRWADIASADFSQLLHVPIL